jgi:phospholipid-binding lipoprotein MlaA
MQLGVSFFTEIMYFPQPYQGLGIIVNLRMGSWRLGGALALAFLIPTSAWAGEEASTAARFSRARFHQELRETKIEAQKPQESPEAPIAHRLFPAISEPEKAKDSSVEPLETAERYWREIKRSIVDALNVPVIEKARAMGENVRPVPASFRKSELPKSPRLVAGRPHEWPKLSGQGLTNLDDPIESINRHLHDFNMGVTSHVLEPAVDFLQDKTSPGFRTALINAFSNLREPISIGSALFQGDLGDAGSSTARFAINSTYGILGLYDRASELGYPRRVRTLDETFCYYGAPTGPYVVMPVFGPSTARDTTGRLATMFAQYMVLGLGVIPYRVLDTTAQYMDVRERQKFIESMGEDSYSGYKTVYSQLSKLSCADKPGLESEFFPR